MTGASAANKSKDNKSVTVSFYGSELKVSLDTSKRVKVKKATEAEIDKCLAAFLLNTQGDKCC